MAIFIQTHAGMIGTFFFGILSVIFFFYNRRFKRPSVFFSKSVLQSKTHPNINVIGGRIFNLDKCPVDVVLN